MKRLRDETSSDFVKSLLDSAAGDVPSPQAEDRTLRAVEQQLVVPKGWPRGWVIGGTVVGIGALLLLLGRAYQSGHTSPATVKTPPVEPAVTEPAVPPPLPTVEPTAPPTATATTAIVPASGASPATATVRAPFVHPSATAAVPSATVDAPLGLRDELALIDEARTELSAGNATSALGTLGRYDKRYPQGLLREEATAVRVEALFAAGKTSEGRSTAEAFLREHPQSTHAQHVRSLLDSHAP